MLRQFPRQTSAVTGLIITLLVTGAASPPHRPSPSDQKPGHSHTSKINPNKLLQQTLHRCQALKGYTIIFYRRERRGALDKLSMWEHIRVDYRKDPKAIKMTWLNRDSEYAQALYIEGRHANKMEVLPRHGFLGLPAHPLWVDPRQAVAFGKSLRPITDFGLAESIDLTLTKIRQADHVGIAHIRYAGQANPPDLDEPAEHIAIVYPKDFGPASRQDLYISRKTGYPVAVYLWQDDNKLLAAYLYGPPQTPAPPMSDFRVTTE